MSDSTIRRLVIEFDRKNRTYAPGEIVSGKISAEFTHPKPIKGLRVVITGESAVQWSPKKYEPEPEYQRSDGPPVLLMSGHEEYFTSKLYVLGSDCSPLFVLPAGQCSYPFKYQLPCNLPSSFEHQYGYVKYTIKAIFDRPWEHDSEVKTTFTVISNYDLNRVSQASKGIREDIIKDFFCSCICPTGRIFTRLSIPATGFVPGQLIPVTVHCENESTIKVAAIKVSLCRKLKFHAKLPHWSSKSEETIVASTKRLTPFNNDCEEIMTMHLRVPSLPPTGLNHCLLIDVDYALKIVICFSGMHFSVKRRFPILIGTVPLTNNSINMHQSEMRPAPYAIRPRLVYWNPKNLPPPSYEESLYGGRAIRDIMEFPLCPVMSSL